ncbi:hypothetical protein RJ639_046550 [Escallonia herrerae]|uniref:Uncharacterized protein n=1 Tax=Escallonia herrerae TaxID=1293975 RepID=A0AA88W8Q9_9ASTE|nr:hypothetical protein RJ639_046550 [Escallonia herrerae]
MITASATHFHYHHQSAARVADNLVAHSTFLCQIARGQVGQAANMRQRLAMSPLPASLVAAANQPVEATSMVEVNLPLAQLTSLPPPAQPMMSFASPKFSEEENKKAAAAAVAAKLAASASSAQMLTSVLSSLVAEEAASMSSGFKSAGFPSGLPMFSPEKRPRLEKPVLGSDINSSEPVNSVYFTSLQQSMTSMPLASPPGMPPISQATQMQSSFPPPPPPPPPLHPPSVPSTNSPNNQYVQSSGMMMGAMPYGYGVSSLPPPPPLPSHMSIGLVRPTTQPPQQPVSQQSQQQAASGGYYRPPGIGFYGQSQPTPPPVPRH